MQHPDAYFCSECYANIARKSEKTAFYWSYLCSEVFPATHFFSKATDGTSDLDELERLGYVVTTETKHHLLACYLLGCDSGDKICIRDHLSKERATS